MAALVLTLLLERMRKNTLVEVEVVPVVVVQLLLLVEVVALELLLLDILHHKENKYLKT